MSMGTAVMCLWLCFLQEYSSVFSFIFQVGSTLSVEEKCTSRCEVRSLSEGHGLNCPDQPSMGPKKLLQRDMFAGMLERQNAYKVRMVMQGPSVPHASLLQ